MFAASGQAYAKHRKLARIEQAIDNIPERTATKVVGEVSTVVQREANGIKEHIDRALQPFMRMLMPGPNQSSAEAKARNRLELDAIHFCEAAKKEDAKKKVAEDKQKSAEEKKQTAEDAKKKRAAAAKAKGKAKGKSDTPMLVEH